MLCGDFNVVRHLEEKWGLDSLNSYDLEFGECLNDLEVVDLKFSGCFYTWNNRSEGSSFVARKLDCVMVNEEWLGRFGGTMVDFSSAGISDHSPAFITMGSMVSYGSKPFKFCNFWLEHADYLDWLAPCWA
jgi:endonuclease/exonuclease/phosphatase family metal-dependent hydrolase